MCFITFNSLDNCLKKHANDYHRQGSNHNINVKKIVQKRHLNNIDKQEE